MDETAAKLLTADEYLLDVSALRLLPDIVAGQSDRAPRILVSRTLHDALTSGDLDDRAAAVSGLLRTRARNRLALSKQIAEAYSNLVEVERVTVIRDEESCLALGTSDEEALQAPLILVEGTAGQLPAYSPAAAANADTIIQHSAETGTPILMKNRRLAYSLRRRITVVEVADQVESVFLHKQELTSRLFGRRRRTLKFFVGAVIAVGGIWSAPLGVAGVVFALVDP